MVSVIHKAGTTSTRLWNNDSVRNYNTDAFVINNTNIFEKCILLLYLLLHVTHYWGMFSHIRTHWPPGSLHALGAGVHIILKGLVLCGLKLFALDTY